MCSHCMVPELAQVSKLHLEQELGQLKAEKAKFVRELEMMTPKQLDGERYHTLCDLLYVLDGEVRYYEMWLKEESA